MLPRLCSPNPPHGAELWGAKSLQSPNLTGPPRTKKLQCALVAIPLYLRQKASFAPLWEHVGKLAIIGALLKAKQA